MVTETALVQCELELRNIRPQVKLTGKEIVQLITGKGLSFYEATMALKYTEALLQDSVISPALLLTEE